jgi:hypothetical protein
MKSWRASASDGGWMEVRLANRHRPALRAFRPVAGHRDRQEVLDRGEGDPASRSGSMIVPSGSSVSLRIACPMSARATSNETPDASATSRTSSSLGGVGVSGPWPTKPSPLSFSSPRAIVHRRPVSPPNASAAIDARRSPSRPVLPSIEQRAVGSPGVRPIARPACARYRESRQPQRGQPDRAFVVPPIVCKLSTRQVGAAAMVTPGPVAPAQVTQAGTRGRLSRPSALEREETNDRIEAGHG